MEKVFWEFEDKHGIKVDEIDTGTWAGKRLRGELLILLKDQAGLKYREISEIDIFSDIGFLDLLPCADFIGDTRIEKSRA